MASTEESAEYGGGFVLILVLFILLVIIGAGFGYASGCCRSQDDAADA